MSSTLQSGNNICALHLRFRAESELNSLEFDITHRKAMRRPDQTIQSEDICELIRNHSR